MKTESLMLISDARAVLTKSAVGEAQHNPLAAAFLGWLLRGDDWIELLASAAERAAAAKGANRNSRNVAVLGFACGVEMMRARFAGEFMKQVGWLTGRPNFAAGGEPCGAVADPVIFVGVVVGAESVVDEAARKPFLGWAAAAWRDADSLIQGDNWLRGLHNSLKARIGNATVRRSVDGEPDWMAAGLQRRGWGTADENAVSEILKVVITGAAQISDGFEAGLRLAAMDWAIAHAMAFDVTALTVSDLGGVLQRVPSVFQRWTWEEKPRTTRHGAQARQWHIDNEYHFQSLLYTVLKPLIPAVEEERYLPPTGTYQPRADLCVPELQLVVEVKYWYEGKSVRVLTEEIAADLTLYLRPDSPYRLVIAVIWDEGARTEDQAELKRGLKGLGGLFDVVIVNRPSCMNSVRPPTSINGAKRR